MSDAIDTELLPIVQAATVIQIQPGDIVVLMCDKLVSDRVRGDLREATERIFPGHLAVVLDGGLKLGFCRPEALETL
jgi:hypothetical protein